MHASTAKPVHIWTQDIDLPDIHFVNMDTRFLLVLLIIVWFAMMIFYGLVTPDKEQVFAQLRALSIPASETPSARLNDLDYVYEYHTRAQ